MTESVPQLSEAIESLARLRLLHYDVHEDVVRDDIIQTFARARRLLDTPEGAQLIAVASIIAAESAFPTARIRAVEFLEAAQEKGLEVGPQVFTAIYNKEAARTEKAGHPAVRVAAVRGLNAVLRTGKAFNLGIYFRIFAQEVNKPDTAGVATQQPWVRIHAIRGLETAAELKKPIDVEKLPKILEAEMSRADGPEPLVIASILGIAEKKPLPSILRQINALTRSWLSDHPMIQRMQLAEISARHERLVKLERPSHLRLCPRKSG